MTFRNQAWRAFGSTCWTGYQVVLLQALQAGQSAREALRRQAPLISHPAFNLNYQSFARLMDEYDNMI